MTVGKMRRLMLKKVVPEKIIPQNIVDFLMDENAELAEPDAYTFLTRLRGLGIGSADFIYLLEGCGAPEAAVMKIKSNPAMNLQSLIVAMESAGMTSKDYTRILYTARQIWERTLTSRLDMMETVLKEHSPNDEDEENGNNADNAENSLADRIEDLEDIEDTEDLDDNEEQSDEFRAALEAVTSEGSVFEALKALENEDNDDYEEKNAETAVSEDKDGAERLDNTGTIGFSLGETEEFESLLGKKTASERDESSKRDKSDFVVNIDYGEQAETVVSTFETIGSEDDKDDENNAVVEEPAQSAQPYNGDTTAIIKIDRDMLEKSLADIARNAGSPEKEESGEQPDEGYNDDIYNDTDDRDRNDSYDEDYDYVNGRSRYNVGALTAASIGAAVVLGSGVAAGVVFGMEPAKPLGYAADENEIFTAIYYAYNEKIAGGDSYYGYDLQDMTVFGDLLVERDGFGTFTQDAYVYTLTAEEIEVDKFAGGDLSFVGTIEPPENAVFADAVQLADGSLIAAFDGNAGGFMKLSGGETLFTVKQDGRLTDFSVTEDEVRLGTVYTPLFYKNFKAADTEVYLPKLGREYKPMPPQSVIPTKTKGYSYGVSGAYSAAGGDIVRADAVLGNPVFASGEGFFAVNGAETGMLLQVVRDEEGSPRVLTADCGKLSAANSCGGGSAVCESGTIVLRDSELKTVSVLQSLPSAPERLRFSGDTLIVADKEKAFLTVDCADMGQPLPFEFRRVSGLVKGDMAVTLSQTAEGLSAASYAIDESGKSVLVCENVRELTGEQRGTLKFGGAAAIAVSDKACGAAYSFFDGVSVVSEYVMLGDIPKRVTLYDDKKGFRLAFTASSSEGVIYADCGRGLIEIRS